jgi:peptidoglycan/LPS O-acetylase OafA/YrhL
MDRLLNPQRHIPALDGIRGIAILGTIAIHIGYLRAIPEPPPRYLSIFHVAQFGWMGVDVFLALSGFLITGILLDTKTSNNYFRSFYARRTLRIFPIYYGLLLALLFSAPLLHRIGLNFLLPDSRAWPSAFAYVQNYFLIRHPGLSQGVLSPLWTLAIEEQFYLVWPMVVFVVSRKTFAFICVAVCVLVPASRMVLLLHHDPPLFVLVNTFTRVDTLAWGGLAALLVRKPAALLRLRPLLPWIAALCVAAILVIDFPLHEFYTRSTYTDGIGFTIIAIGSASLLLLAYLSDAAHGWLARTLSQGWLRSLGRYSYGMYVLQGFVIAPISHYLPRYAWFGKSLLTGLPIALAALMAIWSLAWCSFHGYERHFLHFKKFFIAENRTSSGPPTASLAPCP